MSEGMDGGRGGGRGEGESEGTRARPGNQLVTDTIRVFMVWFIKLQQRILPKSGGRQECGCCERNCILLYHGAVTLE